MRNVIHPNIWCTALMNDYKDVVDFDTNTPSNKNWIITDMRFGNEFEAVKNKGGICIRINRPSVVFDGIGFNAGDHPSECELDHITDWDYVIDNDSDINSLINKVQDILLKEEII